MKIFSYFSKAVLPPAVAGLCVLALTQGAPAQDTVDPDARSVLTAMTSHLSSLKNFSVEYAATDEIVTPEGQKLQFLNAGEVTAQRPDKLYARRLGAAGTSEMFLEGKGLMLYARNANAYLQLDASSIDGAIEALHKFGFDAPGSDLLLSRPLDSSTTDMTSGSHVGMTFIDGVEVHHLAFRGTHVDWQLWVTADANPLPVRYVVTTKAVAGSPQFTLQMRNWNAAPKIEAARFSFSPPPGTRKLDPASVEVNAIGDMTIKGK